MSTLRKPIPTRFNDAKNAINSRYQALTFLQSKGFKIDSNKQICCPFHSDSTPSFSIDGERNVWNCFGCHDGGHYLDLWIKYNNRYENTKYTIYSAIDAILLADPELQKELGFATIFMTEEQEFNLFASSEGKMPNFDQVLQRKTQIFSRDTTTMYDVLKTLKKSSVNIIIDFINDCECGATEAQLISKYYKQQSSVDDYIMSISSRPNEECTAAFLEALED